MCGVALALAACNSGESPKVVVPVDSGVVSVDASGKKETAVSVDAGTDPGEEPDDVAEPDASDVVEVSDTAAPDAATPPCKSDKECPIGVCDKPSGRCVACLSAADCTVAPNTWCKPHFYVCAPAPALCGSSIECKATQQVCDAKAKMCVDCLGQDDCAAGETCWDSVCIKLECPLGSVGCSADGLSQRTCDPTTGTWGAYLSCDDLNSCTTDTCVSGTGCGHVTLLDGAPCNDGDACTSGDACIAGSCAKGVLPVSCDDGKACTTDACLPDKGCVHTPDGSDGC